MTRRSPPCGRSITSLTLADFFEAARRMGFARIELNHKVTTPMLEGIDLKPTTSAVFMNPAPRTSVRMNSKNGLADFLH